LAQILIAGCGYVGSALAELLRDAGHRVAGLKRSADGLPAGITALRADLADAGSIGAALATLVAPIDVAVCAVAADAGDDAAYRRAYVEGQRNLIAALRARAATPRHLFFTSSTAVYAQDDGSWVDETSETAPRDFRGARMLEAERVLQESGIPATALRLGGIYGPGRTRMIESVRSGRAGIAPGPPRWGNRIHRDDAAGALAHLIGAALRGVAPPPILIGVDDEPADEAAVLRWLAATLGVAEPAVGEAAPGARARGGNKRCSNARLRAVGYRFRYPTFREGYGALISGP
jgi:nucleoside-diphosphate-sugar epimerase